MRKIKNKCKFKAGCKVQINEDNDFLSIYGNEYKFLLGRNFTIQSTVFDTAIERWYCIFDFAGTTYKFSESAFKYLERKFKIGDIVKVSGIEVAGREPKGVIRFYSKHNGLWGVDFEQNKKVLGCHNLDGRLSTDTGLYVPGRLLESIESKNVITKEFNNPDILKDTFSYSMGKNKSFVGTNIKKYNKLIKGEWKMKNLRSSMLSEDDRLIEEEVMTGDGMLELRDARVQEALLSLPAFKNNLIKIIKASKKED